MTLRLADKWLWDFWTAAEDDRTHVFYLQAARALGDPNLRHFNVSIGHAVTRDLERFDVLADALAPAPRTAFDDASTWTGSVIRCDGVWHMLYTGTSHVERGLVQRVGLATSDDLLRWRREPGPLFEADPRWYELLDLDAWHDQAWRDPWVFRGPDGAFHAYVTARAAHGPARGRAVIGHARSPDLRAWEVLEPITEPMGFGQMEVPQVVEVAGRWYLLFCSDPSTRTAEAGVEGTGTYYLSASSPLGPFEASSLGTLEADDAWGTYAGKLVEHAGELFFIGWVGSVNGGDFTGTLSQPRRVSATADGRLLVDEDG